MNDSVVAIVSAFFVIGISFGVITVIALAVVRARRQRCSRRADAAPEDQPSWPGEAENDFTR
jgi:hypothetical protein